jgi:hypothetical protein
MADLKKIYNNLLTGKQYIRKINLAKRYEFILENDAMPASIADDPNKVGGDAGDATTSLTGVHSPATNFPKDIRSQARSRSKNIAKHAEENREYEETILKRLQERGLGNVEIAGISVGDPQVSANDINVWNALFDLTPKKKQKSTSTAGSKGVGNGELALYWFLKNGPSKPLVADNRNKSDPDLSVFINGKKTGIEVKSYDDIEKDNETKEVMMQLGRFRDTSLPEALNNIRTLNALFGYSALMKAFTYGIDKGEEPELAMESAINKVFKESDGELTIDTANADNFNGKIIYELFENLDLVEDICVKILDSSPNLSGENIINNMINNINHIYKRLGIQPFEKDKTKCVKKLFYAIAKERLSVKPGVGGYLVNATSAGKLYWRRFDLDKLEEKINLGSVAARGAFLNISLSLLEKI